jgi:hypothetical protein
MEISRAVRLRSELSIVLRESKRCVGAVLGAAQEEVGLALCFLGYSAWEYAQERRERKSLMG